EACDRTDGRHPRCIGERRASALDRRNVGLERGARRVLRARVLVALVPPQLVLHVRRRLVDRRDDGAGARIWDLTSVNTDGGEASVRAEFHLAVTVLCYHSLFNRTWRANDLRTRTSGVDAGGRRRRWPYAPLCRTTTSRASLPATSSSPPGTVASSLSPPA